MWCFCLCAAGEIAWFSHHLRGRSGRGSGAGAPRVGGASAVQEGCLAEAQAAALKG